MLDRFHKYLSTISLVIALGIAGYGKVAEDIPISIAITIAVALFSFIRLHFVSEGLLAKMEKSIETLSLIRYMGSLDAIKLLNLAEEDRREEEKKLLRQIVDELKGVK